MNSLPRWILAAALLASPAIAGAQEVRCPTGYESLPARGGADQRMLAACVQGPVQIIVSATSAAIAPSSAEEGEVVQSLAGRIAQGGSMTASPVRTETIGGFASRVSDFAGQVTMPNGTDARIEGMVVMIPAQGGTVVIMALSRDPSAAHVAPAVRALVPTIVGLGNAPPAWRASASCPAGMQNTGEGTAPNGMRRVARCQSEAGTQLEVLESMLPMRNEADARGPAASVQQSLSQQLQQLGGSAQLDPTQPLEARPGVRGFVTSIHGSATDPRAPQGAPGGELHVEAQVAMIPTTAGHVEIIAISQQLDANALAAMVRTFVQSTLRLDGSGVPAPSQANVGDAGASATPAEAPTPAPPRRREIDLSRPFWNPGEEERPHATTSPSQHKSCGCRTVGEGSSRSSSSLTLTGLLGAALAIAIRTRSRRRNAH